MSKKIPTVWEATSHTKAKLTILKGYLHAWFRILGMTRKNQPILYVDGFAGPGLYTNHEEGSPLAAIQAARSAIEDLGGKFVAAGIQCAFIEKDPKRYAILREVLATQPSVAGLGLIDHQCEFVEGIEHVRKAVPGPFEGKGPLFVFADPFGGIGIPFKTFASCMEGAASELLINLDADGIGRIFQADNPKRDEQMTDLFGDDSWRTALSTSAPLPQLSFQILNLYKQRLQTIPGVAYAWSFAMRGVHDKINYHLVFATKHRLGMEKMKEAMKKIDQTGSYSFSDAHVDQHPLFTDANAAHCADLLWRAFRGRTIDFETACHFALTETPFSNPKPILRRLEQEGRVQADVPPHVLRKKGDFSEDKIQSLRFCEAPQADLF